MKCIPYTDANAHGTIANAYTFRRSNGTVILQRKATPKNDPTPLQAQQRYKFKTAVAGWNEEAWNIINFFTNISLKYGNNPLRTYLSYMLSNTFGPPEGFNFIKIINASFYDSESRDDTNTIIKIYGEDPIWYDKYLMGIMHLPSMVLSDNVRIPAGVRKLQIDVLTTLRIQADNRLFLTYLDTYQYPRDIVMTLPVFGPAWQIPVSFYVVKDGRLYTEGEYHEILSYPRGVSGPWR